MWPDLGEQKVGRNVANSSGHRTLLQKALREVLPAQLEFGKKVGMGAQCGMVGWGQFTQDLVGHGELWTFTSSKAVVRAPMLLHEEENHLQEVHDFGLGIAVLDCSLWSHTVLTHRRAS